MARRLHPDQQRLEEHRVEIAEAYQRGETLNDLGAKYGVRDRSIRRALQRWDVEIRDWHRGPRSDAWRQKVSEQRKTIDLDPQEVVRLYDGTRTCREVGELLGVSEEYVRETLIRLDVDRLPAKARMEKNRFWAGGLSVDKNGYILEKSPDHPAATKAGYVRQHRLVMERHLGRSLREEEVVDHRNGDTSDNRIENLVLYANNAEHLRGTLTGKKKLPKEQREELRLAAVQRARQRVAAILQESGTDAGP